MMKNHGHEELIDLYLLGQLNEKERYDFEEELSQSETLKQQVEEQMLIVKGVRLGFNREMKGRLQREEARLEEGSLKGRIRAFVSHHPLMVAATVIVLITAGVAFLYYDLNGNDRLFAAYHEAYPNILNPQTRSGGSANPGFTDYEAGDFEQALEHFSEALAQDPQNTGLNFYAAICQIELARYDEALRLMEQVVQSHKGPFIRPARWYTALVYLKTGRNEQARSSLEELLSAEDVYARNAAEILEDM
jgi:tetratricopeptide (TPR) repeat protein